ncbi:MAG TPA: universal stress protein [Bacteroidales bacterium]|nr:universal stress protein [Bacteroidales bacterium]
MIKKLLIVNQTLPYDHLVLKFAKSLKFLGAKELVLANNIVTLSDKLVAGYDPVLVEEGLKDIEKEGFATHTLELQDLPIEDINKLVQNDNTYDSLIIVGAKKSSLGKRIFDAQFAYELIQMPSKPILIVRINEEDGKQSTVPPELSPESHVLFPTDFSENAYQAFIYLERMVEAGIKNVTLMHIQDITKISPYLDYRIIEFNQIDRDRLEELKKRLVEKGAEKVDIILEMGRPFREISRVVDENDVDLLILGRQGKGIIKDIFVGSNSNNLARRAHTSVLLIPEMKK